MFIIFWRISKRSPKREIPLGDLGVFMFRFMFSYRYIARCPLPGTCVDEIFVFLPFSSSFSSFRFVIFSSNHGGACRAGRHMLKRKKEKKRKREKNKRNKRETKEPKKRKTEKKEDTKREFMPSERNVLRSVELYRPAARVSARLAKRRGGCPSLTRPDLGSRVMIASSK